MKKYYIVTFLLFFCILSVKSQQITKLYIIEMNETLPAAFRDSEGNIHLYFSVHGINSQTEVTQLIEKFYENNAVSFIENTMLTINKANFHAVFPEDSRLSFFKKFSDAIDIEDIMFFGETYPIKELTPEIIQNHIQL